MRSAQVSSSCICPLFTISVLRQCSPESPPVPQDMSALRSPRFCQQCWLLAPLWHWSWGQDTALTPSTKPFGCSCNHSQDHLQFSFPLGYKCIKEKETKQNKTKEGICNIVHSIFPVLFHPEHQLGTFFPCQCCQLPAAGAALVSSGAGKWFLG